MTFASVYYNGIWQPDIAVRDGKYVNPTHLLFVAAATGVQI